MPTEAVTQVGKREKRKEMAEDKKNYTTAFGISVGELNNKWDNCRPYPIL